MFDEIKDRIINIITSRLTILTILFMILGGILIYRCFDLQIVQGEEYLNKFMLSIVKTRDLSSSRGNVYDSNGEILAYNELAYSVKIEDVYESVKGKNKKLNNNVYKLIKMIQSTGDDIITDFNIVINEDGNFSFPLEGTSQLRFLADVYGHRTIEQLEPEQRAATPDDIIQYLGDKFAIGDNEEENNSKSKFIVGKGYTKQELLEVITIRYVMNLTTFRKYIGTTVATDVNPETVAIIMENSDQLDGVTIEEETVRRYENSKYFAHLLGYTGKISPEELKTLNEESVENGGPEDLYSINDVVGKNGIEAYMETTLQGIKGSEKVSVNSTGKVISILERTESQSGDHLYLTIDGELQIAAYNILEQRLAGILLDKIINTKEFNITNPDNKDIKIPIYDVYFALINNSIIDINHFKEANASETEQLVYQKYLDFKSNTYDKLREELLTKQTPYNKLSKEFQVYQSNIVSLLNRNGIIDSTKVIANDTTQIAWATDEVISLNEYLNYCISERWIDVTKLDLNEKYSDSEEVYNNLIDYIIDMVEGNVEFQKRQYKYMLLSDIINGKQICTILCEQNAVEVPIDDEEMLYSGKLSPYQFMINRITNLEITPAQLALDPCNASTVIVDVNTGNVLAIVTYPGYDNNKMANSVEPQFYAKFLADKSNPIINYATQYKAAPGSTYKLVSTSAGLMEGMVNLNTNINCVGTFTAIDHSPRCWNRGGHGNQNILQAIHHSCNYYFYEVGYRLATRNGNFNASEGLDTLSKYADLFGLTDKSGVEIAEYEPDISNIDPVRSAIGQGTNSFTTVALARYVAGVANSGTIYNLTLLDNVTDSNSNVLKEYDAEVRNTISMPSEYWNVMHKGMRQVVESKSYFSDLAVNVAGKTGTAEQISSRPNHGLFVAYAPYENPEIAIATRIPFGYSSDYAAQASRDIIKYYYGLAEEEDIITGTADMPDAGVSINEF